MTETTYASNVDDLVAQIGELDHKLDKLNHKRRVAAEMIAELKGRLRIVEKSFDHEFDEVIRLRKQVDQIPNLKNKLCMLVPKVNQQRGEIEALKWTIKELTKK